MKNHLWPPVPTMARTLACPYIKKMPKVTMPMTTTVAIKTTKEAAAALTVSKIKKTLVEKPPAYWRCTYCGTVSTKVNREKRSQQMAKFQNVRERSSGHPRARILLQRFPLPHVNNLLLLLPLPHAVFTARYYHGTYHPHCCHSKPPLMLPP